jgi:hypothetical protein
MQPAGLAVAHNARLLRRTRAKDVKSDGRIAKAAFLPRPERDRAGLSVSTENSQFRELHRAKYLVEGRAVIWIGASDVRAIGLDAIEAPDEHDPCHALITGIPDPGDNKVEAERKAEQLALRAARYIFPPD